MPKNIFTILFFLIMIFILPQGAEAATATGTIESAVLDVGVGVNWLEMSWTASTSASSTITIKARTGTTTDMLSAPAWEACDAVVNGADISANNCVSDGDRFIQYYAWLENEYAGTSTFATPELSAVNIKYEAVGIILSSPYDTLADDTVLDELRWSETLSAGTDILLQLRTSANGVAWTDWLGPDGTVYDYFTDKDGGDSLPAVFTDGSGERYFQYRAILDSGGQDFPVLFSLELDFTAVVPVISAVSPAYAWSNASGTVSVVLSGANFAAGAILTVESGGSTFTIADKSVRADTVSFNLDTSLLFGGPAVFRVTNPNSAYAEWSGFYVNEYRGVYISQAKELPNLYFNTLEYTAAASATSSVVVRIRTDSVSDMSGAADWSVCGEITSGQDISSDSCVTDGERYVQYRLDMAAVYGTSTGWFTPEISAISLDYARWAASGTLVSSPYDSAAAATAWRSLTWTETAPSGSDISVQIRTAPDAGGAPGTWSEWFGAFDQDSYYLDPLGKTGIYLGHNDGAGDQWLQYRVRLESDGAALPTLSELSLEYGDKLYSTQIINDNTILGDGVIFR